jgi:protease-4
MRAKTAGECLAVFPICTFHQKEYYLIPINPPLIIYKLMKIQAIKEKIHLDKVKVFLKRITPSIGIIIILALGFGLGSLIPGFVNKNNEYSWGEKDSYQTDNSPYDSDYSSEDKDCSVLGINLHGYLATYITSDGELGYSSDAVASEDITARIEDANKDEKIKAIIIEVDSSGGSPVAGEEVANAIKDSQKPVIAFIRDTGASSAYWAISSADKIFASKNSDIGSIGVTLSYVSNVEKNAKDGYRYEELSSGKYKNSGSPDKPLTEEERALFLRDVKIMYNNFIQAISENRKIPLDKVKSFSDGSTFLGEQAKSLGIIDEIGGLKEVEKYLEEKIGEKPETCW